MKRVQRKVLLPSSVYKSSPEDGGSNFLRNSSNSTTLHDTTSRKTIIISQFSLTDYFPRSIVELWDCSRIENWKGSERKLSRRNSDNRQI